MGTLFRPHPTTFHPKSLETSWLSSLFHGSHPRSICRGPRNGRKNVGSRDWRLKQFPRHPPNQTTDDRLQDTDDPSPSRSETRSTASASNVKQRLVSLVSLAHPSSATTIVHVRHVWPTVRTVGRGGEQRWNGCPTGDGRVDGRFHKTSRNVSRWNKTRQR